MDSLTPTHQRYSISTHSPTPLQISRVIAWGIPFDPSLTTTSSSFEDTIISIIREISKLSDITYHHHYTSRELFMSDYIQLQRTRINNYQPPIHPTLDERIITTFINNHFNITRISIDTSSLHRKLLLHDDDGGSIITFTDELLYISDPLHDYLFGYDLISRSFFIESELPWDSPWIISFLSNPMNTTLDDIELGVTLHDKEVRVWVLQWNHHRTLCA